MSSPKPLSAAVLRSWLDSRTESMAIIDVRDADRFGGHIRSSVNVPASSFHQKLPHLQASLAGYKKVIFHCQLSQQRGPHCAAVYARHASSKRSPDGRPQEIYVLTGGFSGWAAHYGNDPRVTESFRPELYR